MDAATMPSCVNSQMIGAMRRTLKNQGNDAKQTGKTGDVRTSNAA